jgi:hypothetical protein
MRFPRLSSHTVHASAGRGGRPFPRAGAVEPAWCEPDRRGELQAEVNRQCKGGWSGCKGNWPCGDLWDYWGGWQACADARKQVNDECYGGGDKSHRGRADNAQRAADRCREFYDKHC